MLHKITYKKSLFYILWLFLIINLGQAIFSLLHSGHIIFDDLEHLRATYFVSLGDVPYRDFFEHHHPLLWYILAPVVSVLPHNTIFALYVGRFISFGISLICGYFIYKIEKRFIGGTLCALFCLVFYFWGVNDISAAGLFHIKPDTYQRCCFFIGLYYLFEYFRYQKFHHLQICSLFFTLAFLFLQTTIFYVAPLIVPVGYFLFKHPQKWGDFAKAAIAPLLIIGGCLFVLWKSDMWQCYLETNWLVNKIYSSIWLQSIRNHLRFVGISDILLISVVAGIYLILRKKISIYLLTILSVFAAEFIYRALFVSPYMYYLTWFAIYASMLSAPFWVKMCIKNKGIFMFFSTLWLLHLSINLTFIEKKKLDIVKKYIAYTGGEVVSSQTFNPRHSYYWMYPYTESIHDMFFRHDENYSITAIYQQEKSLVLLHPPVQGGDYFTIGKALDLTPQQQKIMLNHVVDDFVDKNYEEIESGVYRLKSTLPQDQ